MDPVNRALLVLALAVLLIAFITACYWRASHRPPPRVPPRPRGSKPPAYFVRSGLWLLLLPLLLGCGLSSELVAELRQDRDDWRVVARDSSSPEARRVAEAAADQVSTILYETGEERELEAGARARREARRARCPEEAYPLWRAEGWGWAWPTGPIVRMERVR